MSKSSGVGCHYGRSESDAAVLADLLKDQWYDSEGEGYEAESVIARLPMTLASYHHTGNPWSGYWDADGNWIE